jgi:hypothetical protein
MKLSDICRERRNYSGADCWDKTGDGCAECLMWLRAWRENLQDCPAEQLREPFIQAMRADIDGTAFTLAEYTIPEPVGDTLYPDRYLAPIMRHLRAWARLLGRNLLRWAGNDAEGNGQASPRRSKIS